MNVIRKESLEAIEDVLRKHPQGVSLLTILETLDAKLARRTLKYRLTYLVEQGRVVTEGQNRATKYFLASLRAPLENHGAEALPLSQEAQVIQTKVLQPLTARKLVGYNWEFLNSYRPNKSAYLSKEERSILHQVGAVPIGSQPAGTYARRILDRLLIDLSWNSSRLEGNTYSLLDTKRLIEFGREALGKDRVEAQMILNHKDAIEFLVNNAEEIGFNPYTIRNLHGMLANNLLDNQDAAGRLRRIEVGIGQSTFQPLGVPQLISEYLEQLLQTADAISDPFEQSFFVLVHLPYLQPFEDVNKRVSRLAANIPLIKHNLIPLAFFDVPRDIYTQAILGVYELNRTELLRDVYLWAYKRSAERYAMVRQTLGEPDPFRLKHREALRKVVSTIVRSKFNRRETLKYIEDWASENINEPELEQFLQVAADEVVSLHEGNFARYQLRPSEFEAWQKIWD